MRVSNFNKKVLEKFPELIHVDGYLFLNNYEYFLTGFLLEKKSTSAELWKVVYPLFESKEFIHLSYSTSSATDRVLFSDTPKKNLPNIYCDFVEQNIEVVKNSISLDSFKSSIECRERFFNYPDVRMNYAKALVLMGDYCDAKINFENCVELITLERDKPILEECNEFIDLLSGDETRAKEKIEMIKTKKLNDLGIRF